MSHGMAVEHLVEDAGPLLGKWLLLYFMLRVVSKGDPIFSMISLDKAF